MNKDEIRVCSAVNKYLEKVYGKDIKFLAEDSTYRALVRFQLHVICCTA